MIGVRVRDTRALARTIQRAAVVTVAAAIVAVWLGVSWIAWGLPATEH